MKQSKDEFLKEFLENYSDLFINTFFLRYSNFEQKDIILDDITNILQNLQKILKVKFRKHLLKRGYKKQEIEKYLK